MARYIAVKDTFLAKECRTVKAGEEFEADFSKDAKGRPMRLGDNIQEIKEVKEEHK